VPLAGVVNAVFRVWGTGFDWVVRFPVDPSRPNEFPLEEWALAVARRAGIRVPEVVGSGVLDDVPFLVLEYLEPAAVHPENPWAWLGRYAHAVSGVPLTGAPDAVFSRFGRDLPAAWHAHLAYNLDALDDHDPLLHNGGYSKKQQPALRALLTELGSARFEHGLAHGDLAPRNLISRGSTEAPVLLDWGTASVGPAPWTDLQRVYQWAVHDQTVPPAALVRFAAAAGLPLTDDTERMLVRLTVLRFLDLARWARERRPDLYPDYLAACAAGVHAALRP
jgi:aminoglycoside phosphotransferase (APT) family kinase protein